MNANPEPALAAQVAQRVQLRLALSAILIPIFFVIGFSACIIGTYHSPQFNNIKIGVVGPATQTAPLRAAIAKASGPAFVIVEVTTTDEAKQKVRDRHLDAAFVPTANPNQPATVIVATAGGRLAATVAETLTRSVTTTQGAQLIVQDVRPLTSGDEIGLGVFLFLIICTICGYLAATVLETVAPGLAASRRYLIILGNAVLVPSIAYLIGGLGFGTYTGSSGKIFAFIGVGALYTFIVGLGTRFFQVLLGLPAIFVSLTIFVFLNIPSLGATYTPNLLPPFWRFLNHFWLGADAVNTERSILYFNGAGVGTDLFKVLAWLGVIVVLLLPPVTRNLGRKREPIEVNQSESVRQTARISAS